MGEEPEWLRSVVESLARLEPAVRADEPDAVHRARAHTRRLRVLLTVVPGQPAVRAIELLGDYGRLLGKARDLEVYAGRAEQLLAEIDHAEGEDEARGRLVDETRRRRRHALERIVDYLDGSGYRRLLHLLDRAVEDAASVDVLALLHEARKAARAVRYFGEASGDAPTATAGERLQDVLGEHRDNTLFARSLRDEDGIYAALRQKAQARADGLVTTPRP